jgi:NADH:ubiquinone oxidoreductase subunit 6 (subunit J)
VVILHAFLSLATGFAMIALLAIAMAALLARVAPSWTDAAGKTSRGLTPGYAFVNLGSSFLAAAAGGYGTAWMAAANPLILVLALAIVVLAISALSALQARGQQPIWYQLLLVAIAPVGVLAGGLVRLRVMGIL